jgi:hypothetical protein
MVLRSAVMRSETGVARRYGVCEARETAAIAMGNSCVIERYRPLWHAGEVHSSAISCVCVKIIASFDV